MSLLPRGTAAFVLSVLPLGALSAANYFVDAVVGNDSYTGTVSIVQGGGLGPWRTLSRVNSATLQAGDSVWFRCGQSWRGTLRAASSPNAASPIRYSRFGSDCNNSN